METNKCPNCNGQMKLSKAKGKWECPYCGVQFEEDIQQDKIVNQDAVLKGNGLNPQLFYFERDLRETDHYKQTQESIKELKYCINELETAEEVEEHIRAHLLDDEDVASEGINQKRIDAIRPVIAPDLEPGERIVFYGDDGVISRGKDFFVVTDRRSIFVAKKKHKVLCHKDVDAIKLDAGGYPGWHLNGDYEKNISPVGNKFRLPGAVVALICLYAFEEEPDRRKIRIY